MQSIPGQIINTTSFAQQIYDYLRDAILAGRYKCGDVINAKSVSLELGVSMMPVREALKRLEQTGLLEIKPRSMCLVKKPSRKTIQSALEMRELLEVHCVKAIFRTIEPEALEPLRKLVDSMKQALEASPMDYQKFINSDWQFHCTLCSLAGNEFIDNFYPELYIKVNMTTLYDIGRKDLNFEAFDKDHRDLLSALERHSEQAVEIIKAHMKASQANILAGRLFKE
jgi:DNA-binding GntR family transcriptional regulator